jgi:hypothetical protein
MTDRKANLMCADMQADQVWVGDSSRGPERVLRGALELPYRRDRFHDAVHAAAPEASVLVSRSDPGAGIIEARLPTSLYVWSPNLTLRLEDTAEGNTRASYEVRALERRPNSEERILADTRERLALLLRGAARILEQAKIAS